MEPTEAKKKPKKLPDLKDIVFLIGASSLFYGIYQIYPPAAFIVLGAGGIYITVGR